MERARCRRRVQLQNREETSNAFDVTESLITNPVVIEGVIALGTLAIMALKLWLLPDDNDKS